MAATRRFITKSMMATRIALSSILAEDRLRSDQKGVLVSTHLIDSNEVSAHLRQMLRQLQEGHDFIITNNGKPAGRLVAPETVTLTKASIADTVQALKVFSKKASRKLTRAELKSFKEE